MRDPFGGHQLGSAAPRVECTSATFFPVRPEQRHTEGHGVSINSVASSGMVTNADDDSAGSFGRPAILPSRTVQSPTHNPLPHVAGVPRGWNEIRVEHHYPKIGFGPPRARIERHLRAM